MSNKTRLDLLLVERGLEQTRQRAQAMIMSGLVFVDGQRVDKAGTAVPNDAQIEVRGNTLRYVSRGGLKLEKAMTTFGLKLDGCICADIGASTGGFTDCALSRGSASSVCVDIGSGQLHPKLLSDARVENMEKTDIRSLSPSSFGGKKFNFICADLSFISLEKVFGSLWGLLSDGGIAVCLVKPQFESDPKLARIRKGVLRPEESAIAFEKITNYISDNFRGARIIGGMPSPILGGDGNTEYLIGIRKESGT